MTSLRESGFCLSVVLIFFLFGCAASSASIRLEAERGDLQEDVIRAATRPGFSGEGYVTRFDNTRGLLVFNFPAKAGLYDVKIRYASGGRKGYELTVNDVGYEGMFPGSPDVFAIHDAGLVELSDGPNTITIGRGWAHFDIDYIELTPANKPSPPKKPPLRLSDPNATVATRALMKKLVDAYGTTTFSGTYGAKDVAYVREFTGKTPAMFGGDLMRYSPSRVERNENNEREVEALLEMSKQGMILTISWHWNAPAGLIDLVKKADDGQEIDCRWYKGFNTNATTFDVEKTLNDPDSADYALLLRDIDAIAAQLKIFADADIPILWRPLHEAAGGWFWWGAKGPGSYKTLWRLMHDRLTNHHGLHNLIWVDSSDHPDWYPGDDVTDIVGIDRYIKNVHDPLTGDWMKLQAKFSGHKLLALTEIGGIPDISRMQRLGVWWSYFVSWDNTTAKMDRKLVRQRYGEKGVTNLNRR